MEGSSEPRCLCTRCLWFPAIEWSTTTTTRTGKGWTRRDGMDEVSGVRSRIGSGLPCQSLVHHIDPCLSRLISSSTPHNITYEFCNWPLDPNSPGCRCQWPYNSPAALKGSHKRRWTRKQQFGQFRGEFALPFFFSYPPLRRIYVYP